MSESLDSCLYAYTKTKGRMLWHFLDILALHPLNLYVWKLITATLPVIFFLDHHTNNTTLTIFVQVLQNMSVTWSHISHSKATKSQTASRENGEFLSAKNNSLFHSIHALSDWSITCLRLIYWYYFFPYILDLSFKVQYFHTWWERSLDNLIAFILYTTQVYIKFDRGYYI